MLVRKKIDLSADQNSGSEVYKRSPRSMLATIFFFNFFILPTDFLKKGGAADSLTKLKVIIDDDDDTSNYNYA